MIKAKYEEKSKKNMQAWLYRQTNPSLVIVSAEELFAGTTKLSTISGNKKAYF